LFNAEISANFLANPDKFWAIVANHFGATAACLTRKQATSLPVTPDDSVKRWSQTDFWMPTAVSGQQLHTAVYALSKLLARQDVDGSMCGNAVHPSRYEDLAQLRVNDQLIDALDLLVRAMAPELRAIYTRRPRLSTDVVNRLVFMAQAQGALATKYMLQAIQTEAFGMLHLMASGDDCPEAQEVLQVVLSGGSLPTKFAELGVSKGIHRRTLCRDKDVKQRPVHPFEIGNLQMPGAQWLSAMRLTQRKPVNSLEDWHALGNMLEQLQLLALSDQSLNFTLLEYCVKGGYKRCGTVLKRLSSNARALMEGSQKITYSGLTFKHAIRIALEWDAHPSLTPESRTLNVCETDWTDSATLLSVICKVFGLNEHGMVQSTLNTHPGVPPGFFDPAGRVLLPLDSLDLTSLHGKQVKNCLRGFQSAASYIADGAALYGVYENGVAVGTIALKRDIDERQPKVEVMEVSGRANNRSGYQLGHLAQSLADKWNSDFDSAVWTRYSDQCMRLSAA